SRLENGKIYQRAFGGQSQNYGEKLVHRTCCAEDRTGHAMLHTLFQQNVKVKTKFYNEWFALDLVTTSDDTVCGVVAMCMETGKLCYFKSKFTVLATGGAGKIFASTTNAYTCTGDGMTMALRANIPLQDMEMWQFHPTGIYGTGILMTEGCRGEGGYLINGKGERYMEKYAPHEKDLACRDVVARSSMLEIRAGRGGGPDKAYTYLKLNHLGSDVLKKRLPGITEIAKSFAGIDPNDAPIPVIPTCHYLMGGIPTNIHGQVLTLNKKGQDKIVNGLYAAGECACVSVHGANRLGANSLLDIVVFGRASAIHISEALDQGVELKTPNQDDVDQSLKRYRDLNERKTGPNISELRKTMQDTMQNDFGVFRSGESMEEGFKTIAKIKDSIDHEIALTDTSQVYNLERIEALELQNLIGIAYHTAICAKNRTESRGAHSREDYPDRDDKNWHKHCVSFEDGRYLSRKVSDKTNIVKAIPFDTKRET
ncbi:MAG: succinate dehydrogenase flavoprotein subunit, partial [Legionellales bacterium]|nr:succinate dehydrogenase flavoprotein subunit [Legionellales bacterium]